MNGKYVSMPTNRKSRNACEKILSSPNANSLRPSRFLQISLRYIQLELLHGVKDAAANVDTVMNEYPDCNLFLQAYYATHFPLQDEKSVVTAENVGEIIKSWLDVRLVFDPESVPIPLYGEMVEIELAKRLDLATSHTCRQVNHKSYVNNLYMVRIYAFVSVNGLFSLYIILFFLGHGYFRHQEVFRWRREAAQLSGVQRRMVQSTQSSSRL